MSEIISPERATLSADILSKMQMNTPDDNEVIALEDGVDVLRKVSTGEVRLAVHGHYELNNECSECGALCKVFLSSGKPAEPVCWNCGALMNETVPAETANLVEKRKIPLEDLNLSVRSYNCLKRAGINTLGNLADMTEDKLVCVRNLGRKSANEAIECIEKYGLHLSIRK